MKLEEKWEKILLWFVYETQILLNAQIGGYNLAR